MDAIRIWRRKRQGKRLLRDVAAVVEVFGKPETSAEFAEHLPRERAGVVYKYRFVELDGDVTLVREMRRAASWLSVSHRAYVGKTVVLSGDTMRSGSWVDAVRVAAREARTYQRYL